MSSQTIQIEISARGILKFLLVSITVLTILGIIDYYVHYGLGHEYGFGLIRLFDLDEEANIPTFFQVGQLFLVSLLAYGIAATKKVEKNSQFLHWMGLSALFFYVAVDEGCSIHEILNYPLRHFFGFSGFFYYGWLTVGFFVSLFLAMAYARFVWSLPRKTKVGFVVSAFIFLFGAVVMEGVGGILETEGLRPSLIYGLVTDLEETLEMLGIFCFVRTLLDYMTASGHTEVLITLGKKK